MEISYVCSLGSFCHAAHLLKRNNLKLSSYPFDWIITNCDNIIHAIKDDFNIFLDKSYYIHITNMQCGHSFYNNSMWWHHNPLYNKDIYQYVVRCVDRFKKLLQYREHKLFIVMVSNINENEKKNIIDFNTKLSLYTSNYTLLVIDIIPNKENKECNHLFTYKDNIHFLELHTTSSSTGIEFANPHDNTYLDNLLKSCYNFKLKNELCFTR